MHYAAAKGQIDCLRMLLEEPSITGNEVDKFGATVCTVYLEAFNSNNNKKMQFIERVAHCFLS